MSDYWKKTEVQPNVDEWLSYWEGCLICACDHGCNQWVKEQGHRAALIMRAMRLGSKKSVLDKLVQMPLKKSDKIWYWLYKRENMAINEAMQIDEENKANWLSEDSEVSKAIKRSWAKRLK